MILNSIFVVYVSSLLIVTLFSIRDMMKEKGLAPYIVATAVIILDLITFYKIIFEILLNKG